MSDNDVNSYVFNTSSNTTRSTLSDFSFSDIVGLDGTPITHQTPITNMVINSNEQQNTIGNAAGNLAQELNGFMTNFHNVNNMFTQVDQLNDNNNNNILNSSDLTSYSTIGSNDTLSTQIYTDNETNSHSNNNPQDVAFMVGGLKKMTNNEFNKLVLKMNELSIILNKIKVTNKMKKLKKMKNKKKTRKNKKTIKNKNNNHNGGGKRKRSIHSASTKKSVSKSSKDNIKKNNFIIPSNLIFNNQMEISPITT